MLERDSILNDVLDRLSVIESRLEDLRDVSRPSEVVIVNQPEWQALAGWVSTGSALRDVTGKIILDPAIPRIQIAAEGYIESADYESGVSGFQIDGGAAEFNDVVVRGTIYATLGEIGGWLIGTHALSADSGAVGLSSEATGGNDIRLWAGHATPGSAPFRVYEDGALVASNANITGTIDANAGHLGSLDVDGVITVGSASPYLQIDGPNKWIQSSTFASGLAGMQIQANGDAEFNNVRVRGALTSTVFVKGLIEAHAGSLVVVKSAGVLAADMVVPGSGTWTTTLEDPPGGGFLFANSDICRCRSEYASGIADVWFTVDSRTDLGDGTQRYTCTYASGTRPATYPAGGPVLDYGISGGGGVLVTADATNAPYLAVFTHAGSPWSALAERGRLGNLNGNWGYSTDIYGMALGQYGSADSLTVESTNGIRFLDSAGNVQAQLTSGAWTLGRVANNIANIQITGGAVNFRGGSGGTQSYVSIGSDGGMRMVAGNSTFNDVTWYTGATRVSRVRGYYNAVAGQHELYLSANHGMSATPGYVALEAYGETSAQHASVLLTAGASRQVQIYGDTFINQDLAVGEGLYVGSLGTDPDADDIWLDNDIRAGGGLYVGSTGSDPAAGTITATDYMIALGGLHVGGTSDPGTDNLVVDLHTKIAGGLYVGNAAGSPGNGTLSIEGVTPLVYFYENDSTDHWWRQGVDSGNLLFDYDTDQDGGFTPYMRAFTLSQYGVASVASRLNVDWLTAAADSEGVWFYYGNGSTPRTGYYYMDVASAALRVVKSGSPETVLATIDDTSGWNGTSTRSVKRDLVQLDGAQIQGLCEELLASPVYRYRRIDAPERLEVGLVAEEAPEWMRGSNGASINYLRSIGFLTAIVQDHEARLRETIARLDNLEKGEG